MNNELRQQRRILAAAAWSELATIIQNNPPEKVFPEELVAQLVNEALRTRLLDASLFFHNVPRTVPGIVNEVLRVKKSNAPEVI